jgi:hypothetical protein
LVGKVWKWHCGNTEVSDNFKNNYIHMDTLILNTKDLLTKNELIDFYKDIAQQQSNNYTNLITVLLGLTIVLVGSTWLWNFIIAKKQIHNEVSRQYSQSNNEFKTELQTIVDKKFADLEKSLDNKLKNNEANLARLYAVNCSNSNLHATSISWWLIALRLYHETEEQVFIRISVEQIILNLNQPNWFNDMPDNLDLALAIQEIETLIPEILNVEKRQIINGFRARLNG